MNKFVHLSEAVLLIAYAIGLWLGESLRSSLFPEGTRRHELYSGLCLLLKLKPPLSRQISYQFQPPLWLLFSNLILPVRSNIWTSTFLLNICNINGWRIWKIGVSNPRLVCISLPGLFDKVIPSSTITRLTVCARGLAQTAVVLWQPWILFGNRKKSKPRIRETPHRPVHVLLGGWLVISA